MTNRDSGYGVDKVGYTIRSMMLASGGRYDSDIQDHILIYIIIRKLLSTINVVVTSSVLGLLLTWIRVETKPNNTKYEKPLFYGCHVTS